MIPLWFKIAYLAFIAVLAPIYTQVHGLVNFLWFSNLALLGGLLAAWLESRWLASMALVSVALLELGWILGFVSGLVMGGATLFGMVDYMFDPEIPLIVRGLSLYHLPLPFVLFWMAWRLGYVPAAWWVWAVIGCAVLLLSYWLTPADRNVNWVLGPGRVQDWMPPWLWLGIVMVVCVTVWWLTHRVIMKIMSRFRRIA